MSEEEAEAELNKMTGEWAAIRDLIYLSEQYYASRLDEIVGMNETALRFLYAIRMERYFYKMVEHYMERLTARFLIEGVSKTGAEKKVRRMHEMAKSFR